MSLSILLIGAGAREVALARAISRSKQDVNLISLSSYINPQLQALATKVVLCRLDSLRDIEKACADLSFDYVVVGPEAPLALGVADFFESRNVATFGPKGELAKLESSKSFARTLLSAKLRAYLPEHHSFTSSDAVSLFLKDYGHPFVIKADGLMGGKGVFVEGEHFHTLSEAEKICQRLQQKGATLLIEEKLVGEEFSLLSFCDGKTLKHMPLVQDNKRAFIDDKGPNTGGMGSLSYPDHKLPFLCDEEIKTAQTINEQAIELLQGKTKLSYRGVLYGGYMKTPNGIKLIEFNCRFGCPEAVNLLPLLETDLVDILQAIKEQRLDKLSVRFQKKASVCKYVVPKGYPDAPVRGEKITADFNNEALFFASVDENCCLLGSRAIATLGMASSITRAEEIAEKEASLIEGPVFHRNDIGTKALIDKRLKRIKVLCHAPS